MSSDAPPGLPPWLKASLAVAGLVVVSLLLVVALGIGGDHGPGMHRP